MSVLTAAPARSAPARAEALSNDALLEIFEAAPIRLSVVLADLAHDELRAHPIENKWSILEIVAHLADSDLLGATRFRFAIAEPGAALAYYEEAVWARELGYEDYDAERLQATLMLFASLRAASAAMFRSTPSHLWANAALHPRWGALTLRRMLEIYAEHGERHIGQILERRALLGRPLDSAILLAE
jgi:uncharacterized damage-inducible protein DinB